MAAEYKNGDPETSATVVAGVVGAIAVFAIIVALQTLFYNVQTSETVSKVYSAAPQRLIRLRADQWKQLHSYRWINRDQGVVGIPIDRAMALVVQELGGRRNSDEKP